MLTCSVLNCAWLLIGTNFRAKAGYAAWAASFVLVTIGMYLLKKDAPQEPATDGSVGAV